MSSKQIGGFSAEDIGFAVLVLLVTIAFGWLLTPYFGAILWGVVAAIVFRPLYGWLTRRLGGREGLAAALTLLIILALVILPAILVGASLVQESVGLYNKLQAGADDIGPHPDLLDR